MTFPVSECLAGKILVTYLSADCREYRTEVYGDLGDCLGPLGRAVLTKNEDTGAPETAMRMHVGCSLFFKTYGNFPEGMVVL